MRDDSAPVVLWRLEHSLLTLEDLASITGVHPELIGKFVSYGLLEPAGGSGNCPLFAPSTVQLVRCIVRLRRDLGVNLPGIAVILEMRQRMEALQREIQRLRGERNRSRQRAG
jgi:DNA-binding transcriptional MerR regulator